MMDILMKISIVAFIIEATKRIIAFAVIPGIHENAISMPPIRTELTRQI